MFVMPRLLGCVFALLCLLCRGGSVAADIEATEARLKTAGIDQPMREETHLAIQRGVRWLLSAQRADGGFSGLDFAVEVPVPDGDAPLPARAEEGPSDLGYTALCALALRHAGTPAAMVGVRRAVAFLFNERRARPARIEDGTYRAGLAAMLVMANEGPLDVAKRIAAALAKGQTSVGSWGYGPGRPNRYGPANLSTAQFGALGLWAAELAGAEVPEAVWERLARGQVKSQAKGRWGYFPKRSGVSRHYPQGTFMGLANLLLAEAALKRQSKPRETLVRKVALARKRGLAVLAKDGPAFLEAFRTSTDARQGFGAGPSWPYYGLYALEKVCIFADVEEIGGVRWYSVGSRTLLDRQKDDGGWGPVTYDSGRGPLVYEVHLENRSVCTAFALLFLLRGSAAYHPVTPRPVDGPQRISPGAVVTPSGGGGR